MYENYVLLQVTNPKDLGDICHTSPVAAYFVSNFVDMATRVGWR